MNIKLFFVYKKNFHGVSGSVSLVNGTIFKYESELTCCNLKFCFSQCSKQWFIKNQLFVESRARWPASRQENGVFEIWPVGLIFFNWDCTCFYEKKNHRTCNASQSQDGGFLEFAVCPET